MSGSELGELFAGLREEGKRKRAWNLKQSLELLASRGHHLKRLSDTHYRIGKFDFWPSTGKYLNRLTGRYSRGVFNLIKEIKAQAAAASLAKKDGKP